VPSIEELAKVGDIVRYANPADDAEAALRFDVLEVNGRRPYCRSRCSVLTTLNSLIANGRDAIDEIARVYFFLLPLRVALGGAGDIPGDTSSRFDFECFLIRSNISEYIW
jgi:hypothetical protein